MIKRCITFESQCYTTL